MTELIVAGASVSFIQAIDNDSTLADSTKKKYRSVIGAMFDAGIDPGDHNQLRAFADSLSDSRKGFMKAVIAKWGHALIIAIKAEATPDTVSRIQAVEMRIEALTDVIRVKKHEGTKAHVWLSKPQVSRLYEFCMEDTVKCERDRLAIALLVGSGLRRAEAAKLTFKDLIEQPTKEGSRTSINIKGKGSKNRVIPISESLSAILSSWGRKIEYSGFVLRSVDKSGNIGGRLGESAIFRIVNEAGQYIGKPDLAPHDLRRTFAQIGLSSGVSIPQISTLLGHASVNTTQKYLQLDVDIEETISDFVPMPHANITKGL